MYVISNRQFPQLFTENRVQTVTHVTWNGPELALQWWIAWRFDLHFIHR